MPISEARDHISDLVGHARYGHEATIVTHYGSPAPVVLSFEEYQRLKHAAGEADVPEYQLPRRSRPSSRKGAATLSAAAPRRAGRTLR